MAVVSELVTVFGFKGNLNPLKDFNREMGGAIPKLTKFSLAAAGIGIGISKIITSNLIRNNPLVQFAHLTDESVKSIQSLELASVKFGASADSSFESIKNLTNALADARLKGNEAFGQFGITIVDANNELKKAPEILKDINRLFNSTNRMYGEMADKRQKIGQIGSLISANMSDEFKTAVSLSGDFLKSNKDTVLTVSDIAVKVGLVAGAVGGLILVVKGLALALGTALAPLIAASASLVISYEIGKKLVKVYETLSKPSIKAPPVTHDSARGIVNSAEGFGGVTANQLLGTPKRMSPDTYVPAMFKNPPATNVVNQTNNFRIVTDNPQKIAKVVEDTVNKSARVIQETSARGGI
jgi:hypothetical protein